MKKTFISILIITLPILLFSQKNPWILKKNKDGVEIYFREGTDSKIRELRMIYNLNAKLSSVVALLEDAENFASWVYALEKASVIEKVNNLEMYYYNEVDFPWPLDNRDLIAYTKTSQNTHNKEVTIHSTSAHRKIAKKNGIVRISTLEIIWKLIPQKDGSTKIDYFLKSDPAGNIPAWMINLALDNGPMQTLKAMRSELKKAKYQNVRLAHIKD